MALFKKKQERDTRIEELEAHVRNIRRIAAEDPKGAGALQSFLIEDGYWDSQAAAVEAGQKPEPMPVKPDLPSSQMPEVVKHVPAPAPAQTPTPAPEAGMVTAETVDSLAPRSEAEAMLEAELQRYLARIAEETTPDANSLYEEDEEDEFNR
jgi:hypothetical protein